MTKSELRKIYLEKRKSITNSQIIQHSRRIADEFFRNFDLEHVRFLHVFLPIAKYREIETSVFYKHLWKEFPAIETIVPRTDFQTMTLESVRLTHQTKVVKNRWGVFEPTEGEVIEAEKIDVVLVPLVCFDKNGFRIGYGKGFYDKFLSQCRIDCLKIGLSYFEPVDKISDVEKFDVRLNFCITPGKVFKFESSIK